MPPESPADGELDNQPTDDTTPELSFDEQVAAQFEPPADDDTSGDDTAGDEQPSEEPLGSEGAHPDPEGGEALESDEPAAGEAPAPQGSDETFEVAGQQFSRRDVEQLVAWAASLSPEQMEAAVAAATGNQQQPTPSAEPDTPAAPQLDLDDVIDPKLAEYVQSQFQAQQAEIERLRALSEASMQSEAARQEELAKAAYHEARTGITQSLGLSDEEFAALEARTTQAGLVPYLAQQRGTGDLKGIFTEALETVYWMTPEFRDRAISAREEQAATAASQTAEKKQRASSTSGRSGAAARTKAEPQTREERFMAMTQELAAEMQNR